ncbi:MAG: hypothetical protein AAB731_02655 [Patescibacteria group bacterium]|mgnify:FL=1
MGKENNPILKILAADKSARAAQDAQMRVSMGQLQQKLCDWIEEAGISGIKIKSDVLWDRTWIDVQSPIGPVHVRYDGQFVSGCYGDIFHTALDLEAFDGLKRIVDALEKGTARITTS